MNDAAAAAAADSDVCYWQLNSQRAVERRTPQDIKSVQMSFDSSKFNFTQVKQDEILFELKANCDKDLVSCLQNVITLQSSFHYKCHIPKSISTVFSRMLQSSALVIGCRLYVVCCPLSVCRL